MASQATLRQARARVSWGGTNLSSYSGGGIPSGSPVVYDVQVDLNSENEGPTASMKWDPSGPGMAVYESFVPGKVLSPIIIEIFYADGKLVPFQFFWSGQSINYGNDMSITVNMQSQLSGLVNANIRNTAQVYDEKVGAPPTTFVTKVAEQFGIPDIVEYNPFTLKYWKKTKLQNQYGNDWTYGNAIGNITKQMGDQAYANNIGGTTVVVHPPFSWGGEGWEPVIPATVKSPSPPDPKKRYGYFLGPSVIDSVTRTSNWKPPQQPNDSTPGTQQYARDLKGRFKSKPTLNDKESQKATPSPLGTANARANPAIQNKENPKAPERQNALNDEKSAELSLDTLMCPVLVGIKPHDIIYIPALSGDFIEDWVVQSVGYSQNNGRINVNIRATRTFGIADPMNPPEAKKFLALAKSLKLVGGAATLEAWDKYAWG